MTTPAQRRLLDRLEAAEAASPLREGREIYVPMVELREVLDAARYVPCDYAKKDLIAASVKSEWPRCVECGGHHAELKPGMCANIGGPLYSTPSKRRK